MSRWLAIATYQCRIDGVVDDSVDFQVRYFDLPDESAVVSALEDEPPHTYLNGDGETVSWPLMRIFDVQALRPVASGSEVAGFVAGADVLAALGRDDPV